MAPRWKSVLFCILLLLCAACGQVGSITGGEKDISAPRVLVQKVLPPIESTSIAPQEITIPFDEFIALNKPAKNIVVTPADVTLNYKIKGKSLVLTVKDGQWKPNTTYSIYLNHAVKDITEQNDSIMAYVFSTGVFLDSLQTAVKVVDAYTDKPLKDITVGLYEAPLINDTSSVSPYYFASTNQEGIAVFRHLKDTHFYAYAFKDKNLNNRLDATEQRAHLKQAVSLSDSSVINLPTLRLMPPMTNQIEVTTNEILQPGKWCLGFNQPIDSNQLSFLSPMPKMKRWNERRDSLTAYFKLPSLSGTITAILHRDSTNDTIKKRYFFKKTPQLALTSNLSNKILGVDDSLVITSNDLIQSYDTSKFQLTALAEDDTVWQQIPYSVQHVSPTDLAIYFNKSSQKEMHFSIAPKGILALNDTLKDSLNLDFSLQTIKDVGNLIIALDTVPASGILFVINNSSHNVHRILVKENGPKEFEIHHLDPGKYSYHFLYDTDDNGKWSTGSIFKDIPAEKVKWFSHISTVRANWDVKTTLEFTPSSKDEKSTTTE